MRLLVTSLYYRPEPIGIATYTGEMCEWFARQGHEVRVVCPPPHYPYWIVKPPYSRLRYQSEKIAGVEVTRCPLFVPAEAKGIMRLLYSLSFLLSSFPIMVRMIFWRPDVVFVIEPSFPNTLNSLLTARASGALALLHVQDFEVDIAIRLGLVKSPWAVFLAQAFESRVMRWFDVVSSISSPMLNRLLHQKKVPSDRCLFFPNWIDGSVIFPIQDSTPMRRELSIPEDKVVCLFSGTLGAKQSVEVLIDAARCLVEHREIEIVICGDGAAVPRLKEQAADLPNVRFLPLQPLNRVNELLNVADIHLLSQWKSVADLCLPSKLLGMVATGRPVVATAEAGTEVAAMVSQCGIVVEPGDAQALSAAVLQLVHNPEQRSLAGKRARMIALSTLDKELILRKFESDLLNARGKSSDRTQNVSATGAS